MSERLILLDVQCEDLLDMNPEEHIRAFNLLYNYAILEQDVDFSKENPLIKSFMRHSIKIIGDREKEKKRIASIRQEQKKEPAVAQPSPSVAQKEEHLVKTTSLPEKAVETANFTKIEKIKEPEKPIILKKEPVAEEQVEDVAVSSEASQDDAYIDPDGNVYTEADMVSVVDEKPVAEKQEQTSTLSQAEIDAMQKTEIEPARMKRLLSNPQAKMLVCLKKIWNDAGLPHDSINIMTANEKYQKNIIQGLNSCINEKQFYFACRNYKFILQKDKYYDNVIRYKFDSFIAGGWSNYTPDQDPMLHNLKDGYHPNIPQEFIDEDMREGVLTEEMIQDDHDTYTWLLRDINIPDYEQDIEKMGMTIEQFKKLPYKAIEKYINTFNKRREEERKEQEELVERESVNF